MSQYTKRKHVSKELDEFDDLPTDKSIVKIISGKGNNLHLVKTDHGEEYLVSMPTKFRKHVWVKRGDYVLVEPIEEGDKVKAEISHVLLKAHIKQLKKEGKWPKIFDEEESTTVIDDNEDEYSSDDSSLNLEENPNHANYELDEERSEISSEDEDTSDDEESDKDDSKVNLEDSSKDFSNDKVEDIKS